MFLCYEVYEMGMTVMVPMHWATSKTIKDHLVEHSLFFAPRRPGIHKPGLDSGSSVTYLSALAGLPA
jgi:hypothetical protein